MKRLLGWSAAGCAAALILWMAHDLEDRTPHNLRAFDGHEVGRLETEMWRSYYGHRRVRMFSELVELLRTQYRLPFWRSAVCGYHAARAAVVFQRGHGRPDYEQALPELVRFYEMIRASSRDAFDVKRVARLELEWWIVHRERAHHTEDELAGALASLQAEIYREPASRFAEHGQTRAQAMLIRDARAEAGGLSDADWKYIHVLLDRSWVSLQDAVSKGPL